MRRAIYSGAQLLRRAPVAAIACAAAGVASASCSAPPPPPAPSHATPRAPVRKTDAPLASAAKGPHAAAIAAVSDRQTYTGDISTDMEALTLRLQDEICEAISRVDGKAFHEDSWTRKDGGGGRSRVLQDGGVFEKAGVGVSVVSGQLPRAAALQMLERRRDVFTGEGPFPFFATGISLVMHPHNPMAPTVHANYRLFQVTGTDPKTGEPRQLWWFGGGADLTPSYIFPEDAEHFHAIHKAACDRFDASYYPRFKTWCDEYFLIKHRNETRGIGGIFFDDLGADGEIADPYDVFPFVVAAGESFVPAYLPILKRRLAAPFTPAQRQWQQLRRGRYVEFNLVYDRGTKFGLATPGSRTESILMSLPLTARWEYAAPEPAAGTPEAELLSVLRAPRDWA